MNTYTTLKASIANWLAQDNLTAYIDDFLDIAEARVNRALRIRPQVSTATATATAGVDYVALPSDFIALKGAYTSGDSKFSLEYRTVEQMNNVDPGAGRPRYFTIRGDNMVFPANADDAYEVELTYYAKFPALSDSQTTNWLTTNFPQVLLYGSLQAAAEFIHDDEQVAKWGQLFQNALAELKVADMDESFGPSPIMRTEGPTW
jgi:hypothetical protein